MDCIHNLKIIRQKLITYKMTFRKTDKIGREHVVALFKGNVELPEIVYGSMDGAGEWQFRIAKEMRASGLDVDLNDL